MGRRGRRTARASPSPAPASRTATAAAPSPTPRARTAATRRIADGIEPRFSPDGRTLAYVARTTARRSGGIVLRDPRTGRKIRRVVAAGIHPDWAPNGQRLLNVTTGPLARGSLSWGATVATLGLLMRKTVGSGTAIWSPDGRSTAYTKQVYKPGSDEQYGYVARTRRLKSGAEKRVFTTAVLDAEAAPQYAFIAWQPLQD